METAGGVIRPYFSANAGLIAKTVNGERYHEIITKSLWVKLGTIDLIDLEDI